MFKIFQNFERIYFFFSSSLKEIITNSSQMKLYFLPGIFVFHLIFKKINCTTKIFKRYKNFFAYYTASDKSKISCEICAVWLCIELSLLWIQKIYETYTFERNISTLYSKLRIWNKKLNTVVKYTQSDLKLATRYKSCFCAK